jgi:hypothetical protein
MEPRFRHDLSRVRIHTDSEAALSTKHIHARAYTVGDQIVFGDGQFAPTTPEGRRLLAHELTHVLQQSRNQAGLHFTPSNRLSPSAASPSLVQRDAIDDLSESKARDIDEDAWKQPNPAQYILDAFDDLSSGIEDNVGAAFIKIEADSGRLTKLGMTPLGRRTLDMLYDAVITGNVSEFEREQADKVLEAKGKTRSAPDRATLRKMQDPMVFPIADQHYFDDCYATIQADMVNGKVRVYYDSVRVFRCEEYNKTMATLFRHHSREEIRNGFELDTDELIGVKLFDEEEEPIRYLPAITLIDFSNQQRQSTLSKIKTVAILGATAGFGLVGGAGVLGTIDAIVYVLSVASAIINDYRSIIMKTAAGKKFMSVWKYVDAAVEYYGWARMGVDGVRFAKGKIGPALKDWRSEAPTSEVSTAERESIAQAQSKVDEWMHGADQLEAAQAEKYLQDHPPKTIKGEPGNRHADVDGGHEVVEIPTPDGVACEFRSGPGIRVPCKAAGMGEGAAKTEGPQNKPGEKPAQQDAAVKDTKKTADKAADKPAKKTDAAQEHPVLPRSVSNPKNYTTEEVADFYRRNRSQYPKEIQAEIDEIPMKKPTRTSVEKVDKSIRDLHTNEANRLAGFEKAAEKPFVNSVKGASNEGGEFSSLVTDQKNLTLVGRLKNGGTVEFDSVQFQQHRIVETKINLDRSAQADVRNQMMRQATFARDWGFSQVQWEVWDYVSYKKAQIALRYIEKMDAELAARLNIVDPSQSH